MAKKIEEVSEKEIKDYLESYEKRLENIQKNVAWCAGIAIFNLICAIIGFIAAQGIASSL